MEAHSSKIRAGQGVLRNERNSVKRHRFDCARVTIHNDIAVIIAAFRSRASSETNIGRLHDNNLVAAMHALSTLRYLLQMFEA